ncbi:hypothetical protein FOL47_001477, partial [Perkinsus chesapeaki]
MSPPEGIARVSYTGRDPRVGLKRRRSSGGEARERSPKMARRLEPTMVVGVKRKRVDGLVRSPVVRRRRLVSPRGKRGSEGEGNEGAVKRRRMEVLLEDEGSKGSAEGMKSGLMIELERIEGLGRGADPIE